VEPERAGTFFYFQNLKSCCLKACTESVRINRDKRVSNMNQAHKQALYAVTANKRSSALDHTPDFAEQFVLQLCGWDVMQHRERHASGEPFIRKREHRGIAGDNLNIAASQSRTKLLGQVRVQFYCSQPEHRFLQKICSQTRTRPKFEHISTQIGAGQNPRHTLLDSSSPSC